MNFHELISAEMWKKSAILGWAGFIAVMLRYMVTGDDIGTGAVALVTSTLLVGHGSQLGKRMTEWKPEQVEQAAKLKQEREAAESYRGE